MHATDTTVRPGGARPDSDALPRSTDVPARQVRARQGRTMARGKARESDEWIDGRYGGGPDYHLPLTTYHLQYCIRLATSGVSSHSRLDSRRCSRLVWQRRPSRPGPRIRREWRLSRSIIWRVAGCWVLEEGSGELMLGPPRSASTFYSSTRDDISTGASCHRRCLSSRGRWHAPGAAMAPTGPHGGFRS